MGDTHGLFINPIDVGKPFQVKKTIRMFCDSLFYDCFQSVGCKQNSNTYINIFSENNISNKSPSPKASWMHVADPITWHLAPRLDIQSFSGNNKKQSPISVISRPSAHLLMDSICPLKNILGQFKVKPIYYYSFWGWGLKLVWPLNWHVINEFSWVFESITWQWYHTPRAEAKDLDIFLGHCKHPDCKIEEFDVVVVW